MRTRRTFAVVILMALAFADQAGARADAAADARKSITAVYAKRDAAAQKKDIEGSLSALAPDFVFVAKDGQKGDAKLLKRRLTPLLSLVQSLKSRTAITKFALKENQATATAKSHVEMLVLNPQTQVPQRLAADGTSEDVWTKTGSGWLQKRMKTLTETASLDGKSVGEAMKQSGQPGKGATPKNKGAKKAG